MSQMELVGDGWREEIAQKIEVRKKVREDERTLQKSAKCEKAMKWLALSFFPLTEQDLASLSAGARLELAEDVHSKALKIMRVSWSMILLGLGMSISVILSFIPLSVWFVLLSCALITTGMTGRDGFQNYYVRCERDRDSFNALSYYLRNYSLLHARLLKEAAKEVAVAKEKESAV